jgi:cytochrome c
MRKTKLLAALAAGVVVLASQAALAEGDAAKGEKIFKKCKTCHTLVAGKKKPGPNLENLFGRTAGTVEGFKYSKAMVESGIVWDEATLDEYLTKPKAMIPKTKMAFAGLKKEDQRADLIAYLMEATKAE